MLRDLDSPDEETRRLAVERIDALAPAEAIRRLVLCLGDPVWRVRTAAVDRLAALRDAEPVARALIGALADGENPGRRNGAVEALVRRGARSIPLLAEALGDPDTDVRKLAVDALAQIGDARAIQPLIRRLEDEDANVRAAAAEALGAVGGEEVGPSLLGAATRDSEDPLVRFAALRALDHLEVPVSAGDLAGPLEDPVLRPAAILLLGRAGDEGSLAALTKFLVGRSRACREAAMRALVGALSSVDGADSGRLVAGIREAVGASPELVATAVERLPEADLASRIALVQFLGLSASAGVGVPILRAARDGALAAVCLAALESLGEVAEAEIDAAWEELREDERTLACELFGAGTGERSEARLLAALDDPVPELRVAAARSIGRRRLAAALPLLVRRLEAAAADEGDDLEEMESVTESLVSLAGPRGDAAIAADAVELLSRRLEAGPGQVRLSLARALAAIARPRDGDLVAGLLRDPDAAVRRAAACGLAHIDPDSAAEPLRLALADESPAVRVAAAGALGASGRDAVVDDLAALADDADPLVRAAAIRALGRRLGAAGEAGRRARALALVEAALRDEVPVALAAAESLGEVGEAEAARAGVLFQRSEPELVREAIRCFGRRCGDAQLDALLPLVGHSDWSVRAEAVETLAARGVARSVPVILGRLEVERDEYVRQVVRRALESLED